MASEVIKLNLIPKGEMPVFHVSQFDNGRTITCELFRGEDEYPVPNDITVELHCRKADNNIVTLPADDTSQDNVVKFTSTTQLTACYGKNLCEVALKGDDDYLIGTLNFILEVEKDPLQGGIQSTSEIHDLYDQIEDITEEVIGDNYYTKTETDSLLDDKADAADVYTKTETDTLLNAKANASSVYTKSQTDSLLSDKASITYVDGEISAVDAVLIDMQTDIDRKADASDVYTKAQVDTALALKANAADVYTKSQVDSALALKANAVDVYTKGQVDSALALKANAADVYTKQEVDNIIMDVMPVDTASGAIATFNTQLASPLVSVIANVTATGGNGTPDNPIPINGYTEANITRCGVNLFSYGLTIHEGYWNASTFVGSDNVVTLENASSWTNIRIKIPEGENITLSGFQAESGVYGVFLGSDNPTDIISNFLNWQMNKTFTVPSGAKYIGLCFKNLNTEYVNYPNAQIELGSTATAYTPYNGTTHEIAFGQTVYGGVLDVTRGKLKPCIEYPSYNGETLSGRWLSSEATYVEGTTPPTGSQVVSLDDYGTDIDLTPEVISAIVGTNNVFADCGNIEVKFKDTIQHYIDSKIGG